MTMLLDMRQNHVNNTEKCLLEFEPLRFRNIELGVQHFDQSTEEPWCVVPVGWIHTKYIYEAINQIRLVLDATHWCFIVHYFNLFTSVNNREFILDLLWGVLHKNRMYQRPNLQQQIIVFSTQKHQDPLIIIVPLITLVSLFNFICINSFDLEHCVDFGLLLSQLLHRFFVELLLEWINRWDFILALLDEYTSLLSFDPLWVEVSIEHFARLIPESAADP